MQEQLKAQQQEQLHKMQNDQSRLVGMVLTATGKMLHCFTEMYNVQILLTKSNFNFFILILIFF